MLRWYPKYASNWMVLTHPSPKLAYKIKPKRVPTKAIKMPSEFCHSKAQFSSDIQFISSAAYYSTSNYPIIFTSQRFTKLSLRLYLKNGRALYRNLRSGTFFWIPPSPCFNNKCIASHCTSTLVFLLLSLIRPSVLKGMVQNDMYTKKEHFVWLLTIEETLCTVKWGCIPCSLHSFYVRVYISAWHVVQNECHDAVWISRSCIIYLSKLKINWCKQNKVGLLSVTI